MKKIAIALLTLGTPLLAAAQTTATGGFPAPNTSALTGYTSALTEFINTALVPTLVAIAFILFLYGVADAYILHPGDETKLKEGHQYILWGVIGFVVIFSVWGLVNLVASTLGLQGGEAPPTPGINTTSSAQGSSYTQSNPFGTPTTPSEFTPP